jgi:hypothetical protein
MKRLGMTIVIGATVLGAACFAAETKVPAEAEKFDACMSLTAAQRTADQGCQTIMAKMKVSNVDMDKMKSCESRPGVDVNKDPDCVAMMKKHPDMVRGHGRLDMDTEVNTPKPGNNGAPAPAVPAAPPAN